MVNITEVAEWLKKRTTQSTFTELLTGNLIKLCSINTVPDQNLKKTKANEDLCFAAIKDMISNSRVQGIFKEILISPQINNHPSYTNPNYTSTEEVYKDRSNLVFKWINPDKYQSGKRVAINAHIDTVAPYFPVSRKAETLKGRGVCDDKSGCLLMINALGLLKEIEGEFGVTPGDDLIFMFVIDEEIGGNGSLSLVLNNELREQYDSLIVLECCDQQIHPANRGAVWYKIEIPTDQITQPVDLAMEIIQEFEKEGAKIKAESSHPLFLQCPVQTSHGIIGPFGEYPSRICGYLELLLKANASYAQVKGYIKEGLRIYTDIYGDKTKVIDQKTGRIKVERHYDLKIEEDGFLLRIWGSSGHMAASSENDNAITKASFVIKNLKEKGLELNLSFPDGVATGPLILEGGQGFVPTHSLDEIKVRLTDAMTRTCGKYAAQHDLLEWKQPVITFEKLHNDAFEGNSDSSVIRDAVTCAELAGIPVRRPIQGWTASCDARLFAQIDPKMEIITTGPGKLEHAHSDNEQINISELAQSCVMLTLFLLLHTRSKNLFNLRGKDIG